MTRKEQTEAAGEDLLLARYPSPAIGAFCAGAEWADANPPGLNTATAIMLTEANREAIAGYKKIIEDSPKLKQMLNTAIEALEYGLSLPENRFCDSQVFIAQALNKIKGMK